MDSDHQLEASNGSQAPREPRLGCLAALWLLVWDPGLQTAGGLALALFLGLTVAAWSGPFVPGHGLN